MKDVLIKGNLKINKGGFGFVIADQEGVDDIFIDKKELKDALDDDTVLVKVIKPKKDGYKAEGRIVEILQRSDKVLTGRLEKNKKKGYAFVVLDGNYNYDLFIASEDLNGAKNNDKVVVKIKEFKKKEKNPRGKIIEVLGRVDDVGVEVLAIAKKYELPTEFSSETKEYARKLEDSPSEKDKQGRKDFRDLLTFTIDGADAKDFDDAISIEKVNDNYILYVHIADVANYVKEKSSINSDAYSRGNSVYLLDRVIPMLPFELSNNLCSLKPDEDRLTMTVEMIIDNKGKILGYEFYESVIRSDFRLVYDDVSDYLEGKNNTFRDEGLVRALDFSKDLHEILLKKREDKGDIDFNFKETKLTLDDKGRPIDVGVDERRIANRIIESFMIVTNEVVGNHFANLDISFVYRVHDKPTDEKEREFRQMAAKFGFVIRGRDLRPKDYQKILKEAENTRYEMIINNLMLRSLTKAEYRREKNIHFGLATENYSHFTAPIRRYSDLLVHRILKGAIHGNFKKESRSYQKKLDKICQHISQAERKAEEAEREVMDLKKCEFMADKVGQEFEGMISSLTSFGFFVELDNTIEGLVHFRELDDDYYIFDESQYAIIGEMHKNKYELGQIVKVRLERVDVELREIDFRLVKEKKHEKRK